MLNVVPILIAALTTFSFPLSDNCPTALDGDCDALALLLDAVSLSAGRLARLDLGVCLLLATQGESSWLLDSTYNKLKLPEAIPLHRIVGWWCVAQSALHSVGYAAFYYHTGGARSLWLNIAPAPYTDEELATLKLKNGAWNSLGLVNGFGTLAFLSSVALLVPALPWIRQRCYHVFQRLHLPVAALFVLCCALHDLPILLFAVPGIATSYIGRPRWRRLPATATVLPGTSGPWVELAVKGCGGATAPRGQWASLRVLPLGTEAHPLSLTLTCDGGGAGAAVVTAQAGDWSRALVALAETQEGFEVEMAGPFGFGGGGWSLLEREPGTRLLLLAGGTGVTGWLPGLAHCRRRACHLVWCVQTAADYAALAERLPPGGGGVDVTVFVTRAAPDAPLQSLQSRASLRGRASVPALASPASSSAELVALGAALAGLVACYWGYGLHSPGGGGGVASYIWNERCLPIVYVGLSMVLGVAVGSSVLACARARGRADTEKDPLLPTQEDREGGSGSGGAHVVRSGRPDLDALVRAAASAAAEEQQRLVVAACGPVALVRAAERSVAAARRVSGVHVEFSGTESRW
jgi:ferredoxin-NADP reductase